MSKRAKRVLYPALVIWILTFTSFMVHLCVLGTSAFPAGGKHVGDGYAITEHGKSITLTVNQYWFSYIHGFVMIAVLAVLIGLVATYYWRGDLKDEYRGA